MTRPRGAAKAKGRGPVEIIKEKTTSIPIYDAGDGKYIAAYYAEGKRRLVKYKSLEAAKAGAKEIIQTLTTGVAHVATFTPKETASINDAVDILAPLEISLTEAVRQFAEAHKVLGGGSIVSAAQFYAKHLEEENRRGALTLITFPELTTKFLDSIKGTKSSRYILDLTSKLKKASGVFKGQIRSIRADDIDQWLSGMKNASGRTKNNYRTALITLFSYARGKKHLPRGEKTEAEFATRFDDKGGDIGIYTPEQLRILLTNIEERFVPFVALGGFAGLRTIEILRLEWKDIWFDQDVIEVGKDKAKTATRRLPPILPALKAWLQPLAKKTGPILEGVRDDFHFTKLFKKATDKLVDANGDPLLKLVHNGLRHSFCSYRMATTKSAAQVALEAGNSPKMLFENYRELVTEKAANEYFGILPKKKGKKGKDKGNVKLSPKPPSTNNLRRCGHAARSKSPKQITRKK
jgi:integrase